MPYTSGIGFRSWHADHPSFKRLGAGTPSRFALVFTSAIERVPKQNRPILSRACPRVSERILAKKRVSEFPNISSELDSYTGEGSGSFRRGTGATALSNKMTLGYEPGVATLDNSWRTAIFSAQRSNPTFGNSDTVQPSAVRALALIRAY